MFELTSSNQDCITVKTATKAITFNTMEGSINADLAVGKIYGPGEYEIGEATVRGIAVKDNKTIYDVEVGGCHIGIIDGIEDKMDELGPCDILCTSSVSAVREISPKLVISMGNVDGMVTDLKLTARTEKKLKVKSIESLGSTLEVV